MILLVGQGYAGRKGVCTKDQAKKWGELPRRRRKHDSTFTDNSLEQLTRLQRSPRPQSSFESPLEEAIEAERAASVAQCRQALSPREALIMRARFGLSGGQVHTLEEIGQPLQIRRVRVRQIEARALEKLWHLCHQRQLRSVLEN
jgi:RNA polymerase sigma factor (sigma-70 family)